MRDSTARIRKKLDELSNEYFNPDNRWNAIGRGKEYYIRRYDSYLGTVIRLHNSAETPTAHEMIDKFIIRMNSDCILVRDNLFKD